MYLCFGILASLLNVAKSKCMDQVKLVTAIIRSIDPETTLYNKFSDTNSSIHSKHDNRSSDAYNPPAISRILSCQRSLVVYNKKLELDQTIQRFANYVTGNIQEDKKAAVILAVLDIIARDENIDFQNREAFKRYLGKDKMTLLYDQYEFEFSDFISRTLLYSVSDNIDYRKGKQYYRLVDNDYINTFVKKYDSEYIWDSENQRLTLVYMNIFSIFQRLIMQYQIDKFINEVDPSYKMEDTWLDLYESFREAVKREIWIPFTPNTLPRMGYTLQKIDLFCQTLKDYIDYVGHHVIPDSARIFTKECGSVPFITEEDLNLLQVSEPQTDHNRTWWLAEEAFSPELEKKKHLLSKIRDVYMKGETPDINIYSVDYFVPNVQGTAFYQFQNEIKNYQQNLCEIFLDICKHMLFWK